MESNRIIIIVPFFHDGGVERWVKGLVQGLEAFDLYLIIHGAVTHKLNIKEDRMFQVRNTWDMLKLFVKLGITANDIVFTSLTPSNWRGVIGKFFFRYRLVTGVQVTLMQLPWESRYKYLMRKYLYQIFLLTGNKMIVASSGIKREILKKKNSDKLHVLWNPVISKDYLMLDQVPINKRERIVLGVGRLEEQKGFEKLIEACRLLYESGERDFKLIIVGEGSLYEKLTSLIKSIGLNEVISINPFTEEIFSFYIRAKVFVLPSIYEGFGNVLAEALVSNCYCISFDINHGPADILDKGKFGELIEEGNINELRNAIIRGLNFNEESYTNWDLIKEHGMKFTNDYYVQQLKEKILFI